MRYLILSDLHSNLEALHAVLDAAAGKYDQILCCGDLVGYGPNPDEVVDWVRDNAALVVRGNHDKAASGVTDAGEFNESARMAAFWTRGHLRPGNLEYLKMLPMGPREVDGRFAILHGSPRDEDEYVSTSFEAVDLFRLLLHRVSFFGHTHLQGGFVKDERGQVNMLFSAIPKDKTFRRMELRPGATYFLNPGSVGQPRDRDIRAAFAIYDPEGAVEYRRVIYDIEATARKMRVAGLPAFLAQRLRVGR